MNIVDNVRMNEVLELSKRAEPSSIKSLDQSERRILMSITTALKRGDEPVAISERDVALKLDSIRAKLTRPQPLHPSFILMKIFKAVLNFFGWRVSSQAVTRAVNEVAEVRARKAAVNDLQEDVIPHIVATAKRATLEGAEELLAWIGGDVSREDVTHTPNQFVIDYKRSGFLLTIFDPSQGRFQGRPAPLTGETSQEYLKFHEDAFDRFFSQDEIFWKRLLQVCVTQTIVNTLAVPLSMCTLEANQIPLWKDKDHRVQNRELQVLADVNRTTKSVDVVVNRNASRKIMSASITVHLDTPVKLFLEGDEYRPSDTVGYFGSNMKFQLVVDRKGSPKIEDLQCDHVFVRGPLPEGSAPQSK